MVWYGIYSFCFKEGFEGQMTEHNIEIGIADASGFRRLEVCSMHAHVSLR